MFVQVPVPPAGATFSDHGEKAAVAPRPLTEEAPTMITFRGSIAGHSDSLLTLRREDDSLPTQNSLPAVGQTFRAGSSCKVPDERLSMMTYIISSFSMGFLTHTGYQGSICARGMRKA